LKGTLSRWNDDKGFGFIHPSDGGRDVFVHISALRNAARRPIAGDVITFDIHLDNDGRPRAVNASIEGVASSKPARHRPGARRAARTGGVFGKMLTLALVLGVGATVYSWSNGKWSSTLAPFRSQPFKAPASRIKEDFRCSGKTHCSQMTSCEEATFYLRNCPGTEMDGDRDGIPCERQWCN